MRTRASGRVLSFVTDGVFFRLQDRCLPVLSEWLPPLIASTMRALAEPLEATQMAAVTERCALRRALLQLLQSIGQVLPQGILIALGSDAANVSLLHFVLADSFLFAFWDVIYPTRGLPCLLFALGCYRCMMAFNFSVMSYLKGLEAL